MILVDGIRSGSIPADDRGLAYGDGLFETLRVTQGQLPLLDYHLDRLAGGAVALRFPELSVPIIREELLQAARLPGTGVVKLMVTRGSSGRGYGPPENAIVRRIVQSLPAPSYLDEWRQNGIAMRICETRLAGPAVLDGLKHLNRLQQVLARAEWNNPAVHEGLMRDAEGRVIEGTMSNLFVVHRQRLVTPPIGAGVRGVMRRFVLETALQLGISTEERYVVDEELRTADEIFVTNSVLGVCPVIRCDSVRYPVGTITRRLQNAVESGLERSTCSASS